VTKTANLPPVEQTLIDLCAGFISANGVGSEISYPLAKNMFEAGIVSINTSENLIVCATEVALFEFLLSSKYPRGDYVARLVAKRISCAIDQVNGQGGLTFLEKLFSASEHQAAELLLPLYGVGPKFLETFILLAGIDHQRSQITQK